MPAGLTELFFCGGKESFLSVTIFFFFLVKGIFLPKHLFKVFVKISVEEN